MFTYKQSWQYHFGRIIMALVLIYFGYNVFIQGQEFYIQYLHAWRQMLLPDSKNRINKDFTYEEVFKIVVQVEGGLFMLGGFLILLNQRVAGGLICIFALIFIFATQDNPTLHPHIKHQPKHFKYRYDDLSRHISLLGAILYLMTVPPIVDPEPEVKKKKVKDE